MKKIFLKRNKQKQSSISLKNRDVDNFLAILELSAFYIEYKNAKFTGINFRGRTSVKYFMQIQLFQFCKDTAKFLPFPFKAWFPPRRWAPSPAFVVSDKFGGNYWRFVAQPSSPAMNIKKFWYSSPKFIAQLHELSFMSVKMWGLSMLQVIFVYIFITWNNIFRQKRSVQK